MGDYFGVAVAGWHDAADGVTYWHDECLPTEQIKAGEIEVLPVFADDEFDGWEWQPVCEHCRLPILVNLSQRFMENHGLVPAGGY